MEPFSDPLVSVVLPTYNRARIIGPSIKSILDQTLRSIELIIIDDGSTDDTKDVVAAFGDPRIRYVPHDTNKGLATALNTGFREARAKFVAQLGSDDLWISPTKLEKEYALIKDTSSDIGAVYSIMVKETISGKDVQYPSVQSKKKEGYLYEEYLVDRLGSFQTMLIKKLAFWDVGGVDQSLLALQDWDFFIRFSKKYSILHLPEITTKVIISPDSLTKNQKKRLLYRTQIFDKHRAEFKQRPNIFTKHSYNIGNSWALYGEMALARRYLKIAFQNNPYNARYTFAFLLSLFNSPGLYKKIAKLYRVTYNF